jgi:2-oxoglutarate ferredoxin oxidoreductase subunit alpha
MNNINIVIAGAAGQGVQGAATILGKVLLRSGFHLFANHDAQSRIRGGHNFSSLRFAAQPLAAGVKRIDYLLALNQESLGRHLPDLAPTGLAFCVDGMAGDVGDPRLMVLPAELGPEGTRRPQFNGVKLLARLAGRLDLSPAILAEVVGEQFGAKGETIVALNLQAIEAVLAYGRQAETAPLPPPPPPGGPRLLVSGHEAVALGMITAGIGVYAAYPISPATEIMDLLAEHGPDLGIAVEMVEDEIAAANLAIGAAYAGARSAVGTSGAGISLMCEAIGLAGISETPLVIVDGQRSGPSTGMATRSEQADLLFVVHASHGEFPRAVLAPTGPEDAFYLTAEAFNLAEQWQLPVFLLTDHALADAQATVADYDLGRIAINRGELAPEPEECRELPRYQLSQSGVSPRAYPVVSPWLVAQDSHEHNQYGMVTDDPQNREAQMAKRMRKLTGLAAAMPAPEVLHPEAATLLLCWGSTAGAVIEALEILRAQGHDLGVAIFRHLFPMNREAVRAALSGAQRLLSVEANHTGQLGKLLLLETGLASSGHIGKSDGRLFTVEEAVARIAKYLEEQA